MAFSLLREERNSPRGKFETKGSRSYTRSFVVEMTTNNESIQSVKSAPGLPRVGQFFQTGNTVDLGAICRDISVEPINEKRTFWKVDCNFSSQLINEGDNEQQQDEDPFKWKPTVKMEFQRYTENVDTAIYQGIWQGRTPIFNVGPAAIGERIAPVNSAEIPFTDPPVEADRAWQSVTVERYMARINGDDAAKLQGSTNLNHLRIDYDGLTINAQPNSARIVMIAANPEYANGIKLWRLQIQILIKPQVDAIDGGSWDKILVDRGMMAKSSSQQPPDLQQGIISQVVMRDRDQQNQIVEPVLLDGFGYPLAEGGTPWYLQYQIYDQYAWDSFALTKNLPHNQR